MIEGITVAEVTEMLSEVTKQWTELGAKEANEDYSDAFAYVSDLLNFVAARMLYNVYKNDNDETKKYMEAMYERARTEAEEAIKGLGAFGIRRTTIDDI